MYNKCVNMDEIISKLTYQLKENLIRDERMILLDKLEKEMNECDEVMALAYQKDMALDKYNDMLRLFKDDSEEVITSRRELSDAKKKLEEHPLVRKYLKAYQDVRLLYEHINDTLFSYLNRNMCGVK